MKLFAMLGACVALTACAAPGGGTLSYHETALRGMVDAEATYNVAAKAALRICPRGHAPSALCTKADSLRHGGLDAIQAARDVYNKGGVPDTGAILALAGQLTALTKEH